MKVLLGISGASGSVYGMRAGELLLSAGVELHEAGVGLEMG